MFLLGKAQKREIELDEGMLHGSMFGVAGIASAASESFGCLVARIEVIVTPLIFLRRVFHFDIQPLHLVLKIATLINRSLGGRVNFNHELAAVGPFAIRPEALVRRRRD